MEIDVITVTVGEDPADIQWSTDNLPHGWDTAHGAPPIQPGTYYWACNLDDGESGRAWAWEGPFDSEEEANRAIRGETMNTRWRGYETDKQAKAARQTEQPPVGTKVQAGITRPFHGQEALTDAVIVGYCMDGLLPVVRLTGKLPPENHASDCCCFAQHVMYVDGRSEPCEIDWTGSRKVTTNKE